MDIKSQLDEAFAERDSRLGDRDEQLRQQQQRMADMRQQAITLIKTMIEPVLKGVVADIAARGYEAQCAASLDLAAPRISMTFLVPSTNRSTTWPASTLSFVLLETVQVGREIWNGKGKSGSAIPAVSCEHLSREWVERQAIDFVKAVLKGTV